MTQRKEKLERFGIDLNKLGQEALSEIQSGKTNLTSKDSVLTPLIKRIIEASLDAEMEVHLDSEPEAVSNSRNGKTKKTVQTVHGPVALETPRDRNGSFEPQLAKKRQTVLNESLDKKVLALYSLGMSYQDIRAHMEEMYGTELSQGFLSKITDKLLPAITA